jgi:endonuclease YncB( thermonuclease family)
MRTGLFWSLHRAVKVLFWCFWIAVAGFLYTQRAALKPAADLAELWWNLPSDRPAELALLSGRVTRLFAGDSLQLQDQHGWLFNYGLAGVSVPKAGPTATAADRLAAGASQTNLSRLVLGKRIDIQVTLANPQNRTGLGLVRVGETNVNEVLLRSGWASLKREQIRALPLRTQYGLVRAERLARQDRVGLWAPSPRDGLPPAAGTEL